MKSDPTQTQTQTIASRALDIAPEHLQRVREALDDIRAARW